MKLHSFLQKKISLAPAQPKTWTQMFRNIFFGILSNMPHPRRQKWQEQDASLCASWAKPISKATSTRNFWRRGLGTGEMCAHDRLVGILVKNGMFCQFDLSSFVSASIKCLLFLIFSEEPYGLIMERFHGRNTSVALFPSTCSCSHKTVLSGST